MGNYFEERNNKTILKLREIRKDLPLFCSEFFMGIENQTTPLTRLNYAYDLKQFFTYISKAKFDKAATVITIADLTAITVSDLEFYLDYLNYYEEDGKQHTLNERAKSRQISTLRSLFKYFFNKEKIPINTAAKIQMPKIHSKEIVRLEVDEVVKILDQAESGNDMSPIQQNFHKKTKSRDLAMLMLFLGTGIRISECVGLNIGDFDFNINGFKVTRKGGNQVILYFSDEVAKVLQDYIQERMEDSDVPKEETALFLSLQKKRISIRAVQNLVVKYSKLISPLKKITPHKLRSTYGTNLYRETQDIYVVAEVLGHKDVNTTKKHYAAISDDIKRNAAKKVKLRDE